MPLEATIVGDRRAAGPLARAMRSLGIARKAVHEVPGQNAGWSTGFPGFGRRSSRVTSPLNVYGGTDESSAWVYACTSYRAEQFASFPWWLHDVQTPKTPLPRETKRGEISELYELLEEPNDEQTYFDMAEDILLDLDLTGNSWWFLDNLNGLGQPERIERLMPGTVKVRVNDQGRRVGYAYDPKRDGRLIELALNEVIHFRYRNPLNRYYGMGVVEAILRVIDADLSQEHHVTAFFDQGAHLSGVLTVPETLNETEFQRMKRQYEKEFADSNNSFRVLIAEGAQGYTPISAGPAVLGVVDLRRATKDTILSAFGTPEFLLGGTGQGGVYKMEEAQNIFYRAITPPTKRVARRLSLDLARRYVVDTGRRRKPMGMFISPKQSDTQSAKVARARQMVGTGATIDQMVEEQGLDPYNVAGVTDVPLVPSGLVAVTLDPNAANLPMGGHAPPAAPERAGDGGGGGTPGGDPNSGTGDTSPNPSDGSAAREVELVPKLPGGDLLDDLDAADQAPVESDDDEETMVRALREFFVAQRTRALGSLSQYGSVDGAKLSARPAYAKAQLTPERVLDPSVEHEDLRQRLETLGLDGHFEAAAPVASAVTDAVRSVVAEGLRRGYSVAQIANGAHMERYGGIAAIYDQALVDTAQAEARRILGEFSE